MLTELLHGAEKIRAPYLCVAGEFDELCPLENTERMIQALKSPKQLVIYADSRHSVGVKMQSRSRHLPPSVVTRTSTM